MSGILEIDNKKMYSIKSAISLTSYSRDYITRLAREQKIVAAQISRQWYIDIDSLKNYESLSAIEHKIRQQHLSVKRKQERAAREFVEAKLLAKRSASRTHSQKAKVLALGVVLCGVGVGVALNQISQALPSLEQQVARAPLMQQMQGYVTGSDASPKINLAQTLSVNGAYQLEFSESAMTLETLGDARTGVLLLSTSDAQNAASFFSDEVKIITDENGQQSFVRVDSQSAEQRTLPFVMVPVDPKKTP